MVGSPIAPDTHTAESFAYAMLTSFIFDRDKVAFVECDTRSWEDQLQLFETAIAKSPHHSVDVVLANAGVGRGSGDPLMALEGKVALIQIRNARRWLSDGRSTL